MEEKEVIQVKISEDEWRDVELCELKSGDQFRMVKNGIVRVDYATKKSVYTTSGDAYTNSVGVWVVNIKGAEQ